MKIFTPESIFLKSQSRFTIGLGIKVLYILNFAFLFYAFVDKPITVEEILDTISKCMLGIIKCSFIYYNINFF